MADRQQAKIVIPLEPGEPYEFESLWAEVVGEDEFVLDNVPFFAYGISRGDQVSATAEGNCFRFLKVTKPGGHSTYRVCLEDTLPENGSDEYFSKLRALGCVLECATPRLWGIDLPPATDIYAVHEVLERGEVDSIWSFEEGHVGHPIS
jgi:hypothetical protein